MAVKAKTIRPSFNADRRSGAFTLIEVAVTIVVVGLIVGSSMTLLNTLVGALSDIRLRGEAFETARQNMETLLSLQTVQDTVEYGVSETRPEIQWQTIIEPFYEPITQAMWVRAVCSASYTDSKGEYQEIELEHWLTSLPANVVRQILQQQRLEQEYVELLTGTAAGQAEEAVQKTTAAYLSQAGLDVDAYVSFLERQRRRRLAYIAQNGFDEGYAGLLEQLREEEDVFLERLGMDFEDYNAFALSYDPVDGGVSAGAAPPGQTEAEGAPPPEASEPSAEPAKTKITAEELRARGFPESMIPLVLQLMNE